VSASQTEGYKRALDLMHECATPDGFLASSTKRANYRRIWSRDGSVMGLAALLTGDDALVDAFRATLETLAEHQGPHGEIPSNVDPQTGRVSYGGTAGRVDGNLWFVIGAGEYWRATGDNDFIERMLPVIEKVRFLLGAWEYNNRGLLYVPQTGDWADEYLQEGYVLYDQLLYLQVQRVVCAVHRHIHGSVDHALGERAAHLKSLIHANYWLVDCGEPPDYAYHEVLYDKGCRGAERCAGQYWHPFFSPIGYGYRFDALANVLTSVLDVAEDAQVEGVDAYIADQLFQEEMPLVPAFHPVITPRDGDWEELQTVYSYSFKNNPHEYQNGGLWPMITGFYVADLVRRGRTEPAERYADGIDRANALEMDGEPWAFPEYVHATEHTAGGTRRQGWSAAAAVIARRTLDGDRLLRIDDEPG